MYTSQGHLGLLLLILLCTCFLLSQPTLAAANENIDNDVCQAATDDASGDYNNKKKDESSCTIAPDDATKDTETDSTTRQQQAQKSSSSTPTITSPYPLLLKHQHDYYINGTWVKPSSSMMVETPPQQQQQPRILLPVVDPSTAEPIASIVLGTWRDTDVAVRAANDALVHWSIRTTPAQRRQHLERALDLYWERRHEIASVLSQEMGAPIDLARGPQVGSGAYVMETTLEALDHFEFERTVFPSSSSSKDEDKDASSSSSSSRTTILMDPVGVVAMITPWNWPLNQIALKVFPALAVGCTCVLKPSEVAPLNAVLFAEIMHEAGFPPGVFNLVQGEGDGGVGEQLSRHVGVDMVSFTGSARAGRAVSVAAADTLKRVSLELGGKGAYVIFADIKDWVEETVEEGVYSCFANSGQSCNAPTRMLVERSIYDRAVEVARRAAGLVEVKSAHERGDHIGPVVSQAQFEKVQRYIELGLEEGARLIAGGPGRPHHSNDVDDDDGTTTTSTTDSHLSRGYYVRPTVFADCNSTMTIMREEIFGPVLCITPFDTDEEAIEIANDTPYGLTNYVYSRNSARRRRLARALRSGMVEMNGIGQDGGSPFGGMKASGNGREGGIYGLEEFCEVKAVTGYKKAKRRR